MSSRGCVVVGIVLVVLVATRQYSAGAQSHEILVAKQHSSSAQTDKIVAHLTNKLGVESQVAVDSINSPETMPEMLCPANYLLTLMGEIIERVDNGSGALSRKL
jgi:hypothetical protein